MNLLFFLFHTIKVIFELCETTKDEKIVFDLPFQVLKLVLLETKKRAQRFTNFIVT